MPWEKTLTEEFFQAVQKNDYKELNILIRRHGFSRIKNGGCGLLRHAVSNRHVKIATLLLQKGVKVNDYENHEANTALHLATQNGHAELVEMLINKNALINAYNCNGKTPLHIATEKGDKNIVQLLLNKGADGGLRDSYGMEPLHIACRNEFVEIIGLLLSSRTQMKYSNPQSLNLTLLVACKYGTEKIITSLLNAGADPNAILEPHSAKLIGTKDLGVNPLHFACEKRFESIIELLLKLGGQINCSRPQDGYKPLHIASQDGCEKIVYALLSNGADPDAKADENSTPLHLAAKRGYLKIVEALVSNAANVNAQTCKGQTPLHSALGGYGSSDEGILRCLLGHGADPNIRDDDNVTPLHLAMEYRNLTGAQLLLNNGANVNLPGNKGFTPLHVASEKYYVYGYPDVEQTVRLLLSYGADPNNKADGDVTPLHVAVKNGCSKNVEALLNSGANINLQTSEGSTPLLLATECRKESFVKILLERGAHINTADAKNNTPFYIAVESRSSSLINCILQYKPNINDKIKKSILYSIACDFDYRPVVDYLIEVDFVIDEEDMKNCNLLPAAVVKGYTKIVQYILDSGADPNSAEYGSTLLHCAVANKHEEIMKLLLSSGCDTNAKDEKGNTPIYYAFNCNEENECMEIIQCLLVHGADVKKDPKLVLEALNKNFLKVYKTLIDKGAGINALDEYTIKSLHLAAGKGRKEVVHILLELGVDVNSRAVDESTALHFACIGGCQKTVDYLCCNGANINAQNENGSTPLHLAYEYKHKEIVVYLCSKEANVNLQNQSGLTPLHYASRRGHKEIVEILLNNKANANVNNVKDGLRPLHEAACKGFVEVVEILLNFGAEIDAQGFNNETALHLAVSNQQNAVVKFLLENGCDINLENNHGTALDLAILKGQSFEEDMYEYQSDYYLIIKMFTKHMIQLNVAGLFLNRIIIPFFDSHKVYKDCEEEVQRMKKEKVCCHITLYDILVSRNNPTYAKNESLMEILKSYNYSNFPIYGNLIMISVKNSKVRNEFLASGQKSFNFLVKTSNVVNKNKSPILLPEILENILAYLNTKDLKSLISCAESIEKQLSR